MRILLVGSHGTGKTTLARDIQKAFPSFHIIDSIHRKAKILGFQIGKTDDVISQIETVQKYLKQIRPLEKKSYIAVNGIIRQTAYAIYNKLPESIIEIMMELCCIEKKHFVDLVIYHPIEFPLEKDGIRDEDIQFQKEVDNEIRELLGSIYGYCYLEVKGTPEKRIKDVCYLLHNMYGVKE